MTDNTDRTPEWVHLGDETIGSEGRVIIRRAYVAKDDCGNLSATCTQTITQIPPSLVTGSSHGMPADGEFRLQFHQADAPGRYRLRSSNPGRFYYSAFITGEPGEPFAMDIAIPAPFVTQGASPVQAFSTYTILPDPAAPGGYNVLPGEPAGGVTITTGYTNETAITSTNGSAVIRLDAYCRNGTAETTAVHVQGSVPDTRVLAVMVHLDYGLKGSGGWRRISESAVNTCPAVQGECSLQGWSIAQPNPYVFSFIGGSVSDARTIQSVNVFR